MFDGISILGLSQSGLLAIVVLLLLTDNLVPGKRLREERKRIAAQDEIIKELAEQNSLLLKSVPLVNSVMAALHRAADDETDGP